MGVGAQMFMVSAGVNAAASVRVGNELGGGNPKSAAFSVFMATLVSFLTAAMEAVLVLSLRHVVSYAFTGGERVAAAVSDLCPLLAVTLILNGGQPVLSGVAVGCGWQTFVAYVNLGCFYVVGVPLGCLLGLKFDLGAKGIWSAMLAGTAMQTIIALWFTFCTNWNEDVEKAKGRLNTWEDLIKILYRIDACSFPIIHFAAKPNSSCRDDPKELPTTRSQTPVLAWMFTRAIGLWFVQSVLLLRSY